MHDGPPPYAVFVIAGWLVLIVVMTGMIPSAETQRHEPGERAAAPPREGGVIESRALHEEVAARFEALERCRAEVARAAGLPVDQVAAGSVRLTWTILPTGETRDPIVREGSHTDRTLMDCVRQRMNTWDFSKPTRGPVQVEVEYAFPRPPGNG